MEISDLKGNKRRIPITDIEEIEPVHGKIFTINIYQSSLTKDLLRYWGQVAKQAEKMSEEISHMTEHGLRFDEETAENIGRAEAKHSRSGRIALWVIAATLVYIAYQVV